MKEKVYDASRDFGKVAGLFAAIAVVASILLVHVWNQYRITQLGYDIASVTHKHRRLIEENKKLSIEVAVQGRTERMTEVARDNFGLQPLQPMQVKSLQLLESLPAENNATVAEVALGY